MSFCSASMRKSPLRPMLVMSEAAFSNTGLEKIGPVPESPAPSFSSSNPKICKMLYLIVFSRVEDPTGLTSRMEIPGCGAHQTRSPTPRIPPEHNVPRGFSLLSMEPLRESLHRLLSTKRLCAKLKRIPMTFINTMTISENRDGLISPQKELSSQQLLWM